MVLPVFLAASAAQGAETCVVRSVELKDTKAKWHRVSEPDSIIPFGQKEAAISFFNNGRVPPDGYVNFRVEIACTVTEPSAGLERHATGAWRVSGKSDWPLLPIKRGSFVRLAFSFDPLAETAVQKIRRASVLAGEETREAESKDLFSEEM